MKTEDKELLLKDLCARKPYGVILHFDEKLQQDDEYFYGIRENGGKDLINDAYYIEEIKPYLRPMSSMTEKEKEEFVLLQNKVLYNSFGPVTADVVAYVNWLLAHHLDFRGFIPVGLALEAPEDMYKID